MRIFNASNSYAFTLACVNSMHEDESFVFKYISNILEDFVHYFFRFFINFVFSHRFNSKVAEMLSKETKKPVLFTISPATYDDCKRNRFFIVMYKHFHWNCQKVDVYVCNM